MSKESKKIAKIIAQREECSQAEAEGMVDDAIEECLSLSAFEIEEHLCSELCLEPDVLFNLIIEVAS